MTSLSFPRERGPTRSIPALGKKTRNFSWRRWRSNGVKAGDAVTCKLWPEISKGNVAGRGFG